MPTRTVTATLLSRKLSELLNQVRYQGMTLEVKRGNEIIACVTPPASIAGYPIEQLDRLLASVTRMSDAEADDFLRDIHEGVGALTTEADAWGS